MMQPHRLQVSDRVTRSGVLFLHVGGLLLCSTMLSLPAAAQPASVTATKVKVLSTETHQFALTTSTDKKIINIPTQPEGRTVSGEIVCNMQTQAVLNNWYPFRFYMYKSVGGQLNLIKGGGLSTTKQTYSYTATKADDTSKAKYLFSAHLNHAQVTGQCSLTVSITEEVPLSTAPKIRQLPAPKSPTLQRIPRPPQ